MDNWLQQLLGGAGAPQPDQPPAGPSLLQRLLGQGDPEAAGAAQASQAMEPVTGPYMRDVASGQVAANGLQQLLGGYQWDQNATPMQNAVAMSRDPTALAQAANVALSMGPGAIRAYHGSPYNFDKFDLSKIGTGEGAQAYGHGLYFAENPSVAESYKIQGLASTQPAVNVASKTIAAGNDPQTILRAVFPKMSSDEIAHAIEMARNPPPGRMYEVNINADPEQFLNWDKPLAQQPQSIVDAIRSVGRPPDGLKGPLKTRAADLQVGNLADIDGHSAYTLANGYHDPAGASAALREAGIPGIRYLDQGSRGAGDGTSNYVVFDPKLIDILRKYGLGGLLGGAGAVAAGNPYGEGGR